MRGKIPISNQNDKKSSKLHLKKHVNSRKKKIRQQRRKTLIKGGDPPKTGGIKLRCKTNRFFK